MKKKEEVLYTEKDVVDILSKLGVTTKSEDDYECDCDECRCDDEDEEDIGFPCSLNIIPKYDNEKFQAGAESISEFCGAITALRNVGVKIELAVEILMNLKMMSTEMEALIENGKVQKEVSKNTFVNIEKQQI